MHPFVLFLCCFHSEAFFEAFSPFLCCYTAYCFNSRRVESNERFLLLWSCFLRLCEGERRERVMEVVCSVRRQVEASALPLFDRLFRVE